MIKITKLFSLTLLFLLITEISFSQTVYTWNGSVNSNFSAAGNWTPFRQIGLITDILVFENGTTLNVTNVYQVTIGQLIVRNNTSLILSPATGNAKLVTIKGSTGEDLVIEEGSSLKVSGNDPALNFYIGTGATAQINGLLTFEGQISHYINSADAMAIRFKNGAVFSQNCPGSIFSNTGVNNTAVFEGGSTFKINHINAADPFGLNAPGTKILFEEASSLQLCNINSIHLNGRNFANLTVEPGASVNIIEAFSSDLHISNLTVKENAVLNLKNTNTAYTPSVYLSGNVNINGTFKFAEETSNKFNIVFNGINTQNISGNGVILIPSNLNRFELKNTISLHRALTVNCPVTINRYEIITNGFNFTFNPEYGNPFNGSKTVNSGNGPTESSHISTINSNIPSEFSISQNYPNPFNPETKIDFSLPVDSKVNIKVYDITGKSVAELINGNYSAGTHTVNFNGSNLSSGIYFYTITAGSYIKTNKMILNK